KKAAIEVDLPAVAQLEGDRLALRRVVFNLLSNALEYSSSGSTVTVHLSKLTTDDYELTVVNQGEPISQEDIQNLFQRFWQGKRFSVGTGLGLYLARQVVEGH